MKKLSFLFLLAASAFGQSTAGPFVISSGTSPCAQISTGGQSAVGITVTGTFSATLQPEVSIQGQAMTNIQVTPSSSSTAQSTITAVGNYTARVGGYDVFYVCVTAYTSGTATIRLNSTQASASLGGTGGGGGAGSAAFSAITSGTNTTAAMHVGTGATLDATGSGTIIATSCTGCSSTFPVTGTSAKLTDLGGGIISGETLAGGPASGTFFTTTISTLGKITAGTTVQAAGGSRAAPSHSISTTAGMYGGTGSTILVSGNNDAAAAIGGTGLVVPQGGEYCWSSGSDLTASGAGCDVTLSESGGEILLGHPAGSGTDGRFFAGQYVLDIPCVSAGGTCGAKSSGFITIAVAATTATVATTAVHSDAVCTALNSCSHIHIQEDSTKGAALGVTCNATVARTYAISTVTNSTSFVITSSAAPAVNPACLSFTID